MWMCYLQIVIYLFIFISFHHSGRMKALILHLIHLVHQLPGQISRLRPGIMLSLPVHVRSIRWIRGVCCIFIGHGR